jgi:hypothetical protein
MFKGETQALPVRVQHQPDNIIEGGMPGYGLVSRFILPACDDPALLVPKLYTEIPEFTSEWKSGAWHLSARHFFPGTGYTGSDLFSIKIYREIWCLAPGSDPLKWCQALFLWIKIYREIWCLAPFCPAFFPGYWSHGVRPLFDKNLSGNLVPGTVFMDKFLSGNLVPGTSCSIRGDGPRRGRARSAQAQGIEAEILFTAPQMG